MKQHDFKTDQRGVSEVLGAVLVFGLVLAVLVIIQVSGVPNANAQIEFQHNERVHTDFQELSEDVLASGSLDTVQATNIESGVRYPVRLFLLNPGPAAGAVLTETGGFTVLNAVAADTASETGDYWNGDPKPFVSERVRYSIDYSVYAENPETVFEYNTVYNRFADDTVLAIDEGSLVDGNRITLFALDGDLTDAAVGTRTVELTPRSAPAEPLSIRASPGNQLRIRLTTDLSVDQWNDLLAGEPLVTAAAPGAGAPSNTVDLVFAPDETYELRLAKLQVSNKGVSDADEGPRYVTNVSPKKTTINAAGTALTVSVRDGFNNPVAGAPVTFEVTGGLATLETNTGTTGTTVTANTNERGEATVIVDPDNSLSTVSIDAYSDYDGDGDTGLQPGDTDSFERVKFTNLVVELDPSTPNDLASEINPVSAGALEFKSASIVEIGTGGNKQDVLELEFENAGTADVELTQIRVNTFIATALGGRSGVPDVQEMRLVEGTVSNPSSLNTATSLDVRGDYVSFSSTVSPGTVVYTVQFRDGSGNEIEVLEGDMFMLSIDYADVGIGRYLVSVDP